MSRQYLNAAKVIDGVVFEKKSFKSVCAGMKIGKTEYALAAETLKYKHILDDLFLQCNVSADDLSVRYSVLLVMTYELLFGQKKISSGGAVKRKLKEIESNLKTQLDLLLLEKQQENNLQPDTTISPTHNGSSFSSNSSINNLLNPIRAIKYIRVNQIKMKLDDALTSIKELCQEAHFDHHIPTLICLPNHQKGLGENELVKSGKLIIQDKSSCFPSQILGECWWRGQEEKRNKDEMIFANSSKSNNSTSIHNRITSSSDSNTKSSSSNNSNEIVTEGPEQEMGDDIIDACSAPGNKTSHLANFIHTYCCGSMKDSNYSNSNNSDQQRSNCIDSHITTHVSNNINNHDVNSNKNFSQILAFEKSPDRFELLSYRTIKQAGAGHIIQPTLTDFLTVNPLDPRYSKVRYCLMDPSCSGSGLSSIERLVERRGAVVTAATTVVQQQEKGQKNSNKKNNSKNNINTTKAAIKAQEDEKQRNYDRLLKLQAFQITMLLHSFRFPQIEYVVYSTCSIHQEENEQVVAQVLQRQREAEEVTDFEPIIAGTNVENINNATNNSSIHTDNGTNNGINNSSSSSASGDENSSSYIWDVVSPTGISVSEWSRRGELCAGLTLAQSQALIRCAPEDMTSGFFVALFRKIKIPTSSSVAEVATSSPSSSVATKALAFGSKAQIKSSVSEKSTTNSSNSNELSCTGGNKKRKLLIQSSACHDAVGDNDDDHAENRNNNKKFRTTDSSSSAPIISPLLTYWKPWSYKY